MSLTFVKVLHPTVKGNSDTVVPVGMLVRIVATREDPDGLKLLVRPIGDQTSHPFQIPANVTNYV